MDIRDITLAILDKNGQPVGTGFLVTRNLAVTCAHVVAAADAFEGETLPVRFTGQDEKLNVLVLPEYWRDIDKGDVSFLRLERVPDNVVPLQLGFAEHSHPGNVFRSFGYATAADVNGIFATGIIDGYLRERALIQAQSPQANHGISGSPVLDEKRGIVIGMIAKGHTELGRNQETIFATPSELLIEICPEIRPSETSPYLGLETFTERTAEFFFGREALTEKLLDVLRGGCRFLAVFGPSGSGKSSVVRAGLRPALKKGQLPGSQKWAQITMRPTDSPFEQMKATGFDPVEMDRYLQNHPEFERVVLFIDQFEELFTLCPDDLRDRFTRDLATALENSKLVLTLCMRDDFYSAFNAKAAQLAESRHLKIENVPGILKRDELVAMIEQPAEVAGAALEEGLTELMLKDLATAGEVRSSTLPLLEFSLLQLWEKRREGWLTHEAYQSIGGVTGSLARWADDAYSNLLKEDQVLAESLLTSLVHLGDEAQGLPDTRRRRILTEFDESTRRVIKHFADRRLIITGNENVEFVHDALVSEWGRLLGWIKNDHDNLRLRAGVVDAARQWDMSGRDENLLNHRGARLELAIGIGKDTRYSLGAMERAYLDACIGIIEKEKRAKRSRIITFFSIGVMALIAISAVTTLAVTGQLNRLIYRPLLMEWVQIPQGNFLMGSSDKEIADALAICPSCDITNEQPQHLIYLDEYQIGRYEVTNKQYYQCVLASVCNRPANTDYDKTEFEKYPVASITWNDASIFCEWNGGRLPTEAEWEKAARGAITDVEKTRVYPWGSEWGSQKANVYQGENGTSMPVGSYSPVGDSVYGLSDMSGNVWEWVADWYDTNYYTKPFDTNPAGPETGIYKVRRGGSFTDSIVDARSTYRSYYYVDSISNDVGFRCAK